MFKPLSVESYAKIAKLMLSELYSPLKEKNIRLTIDESVYDAVAKKAHGGKYGGRDIRRVIRSDIEDSIAELIIDHAENPLSEINLGTDGDVITVTGK